jgi:hypothetical protein
MLTMDELAQRVVGQAEVAGHLLLAVAADRGAQQRLALALGERCEARERLAHEGAAFELLGARVHDLQHLVQLVVVVPAHPQRVERGVVDDPVEPWPQLAHLVAATQRRPRAQQRLLQGVLGPPLRQHTARGAQQRPPVALDDRLERALVPRAGQLGQSRVGLRAQKGQ